MVKNERDRGVVDIIPGTLATAPDVISSPEEEGSAERLEKLEIEKNSIDRSVGRSIGRSRETRTLPIVVSFVATNMPRRICIHAEIRGLSARSRKYLTSIEATVWNSSCFGFSQIYFYRASREDTYVSTNLFERNGKRRRIFPRLAVTNESRDIEKLFVPREKTISISRLL